MHLLRKADGLGSPSKVKGARVAKGTYPYPPIAMLLGLCGMVLIVFRVAGEGEGDGEGC